MKTVLLNLIKKKLFYCHSIYAIFILDCFTKLLISLKSGKNLNETICIVFIFEKMFFLLAMIVTSILESQFEKGEKHKGLAKYNDVFYLFMSICISASFLEPKMIGENDEVLVVANLLEGVKITIAQIIWSGSLIEISSLYISFSLNFSYFFFRLYSNMSENSIVILLLCFLLILQSKTMKKSIIHQKISLFSSNVLTTNISLQKKKNFKSFFEEQALNEEDFINLFENLFEIASDSFILFNKDLEAVFFSKSLPDLFPNSTNLINDILLMKIENMNVNMKKTLLENMSKYENELNCLFHENLLLKEKSVQILKNLSFEDDSEKNISIKRFLEVLMKKSFVESNNEAGIIKIKQYSFESRPSPTQSPKKVEIALFLNKKMKFILLCFKKEPSSNKKQIENFTKILSHISTELSNSVSSQFLLLQTMQSSVLLHNKLSDEFVSPTFLCSKFLAHLKNEIADICDILNGETNIMTKEFNLKELVMETINMFALQCEYKEISISVKYDTRIATIIKSEPRFINQILINLIKNSIRNTCKNTIHVKIEMESDESSLKITVVDSGNGLTKDEKKNCVKTFAEMNYFNSLSFDPYNIGYELFLSHLLAIILTPENVNDKGLSLISEPGVGSSMSFRITDHENRENVRDNEEDLKHFLDYKLEKMSGITTKQPQDRLATLKGLNSYRNRKSPRNTSPKRGKKTGTLILESEGRNRISQTLIKMSSVQDKSFVNEFYKNEENTFKSFKSKFSATEGEKSESRISKFHDSKTMDLNILEYEYSSILCCNKSKSEIVWSFSSDSQIFKIMSECNEFENHLKEIRLNNKQKKCVCSDVLICDYDEISNYSLKKVFAVLGFAAESVSLSPLAIIQIKRKIEQNCCKLYKFILIFTQMPNVSGFELCERIRETHLEKNLAIPTLIAITTKVSEKEQELIKMAGFSDFVCKPIMPNTVNYYVEKYTISKKLQNST